MHTREILVRVLICKGMMMGIGRLANTKSVNIFIATFGLARKDISC